MQGLAKLLHNQRRYRALSHSEIDLKKMTARFHLPPQYRSLEANMSHSVIMLILDDISKMMNILNNSSPPFLLPSHFILYY